MAKNNRPQYQCFLAFPYSREFAHVKDVVSIGVKNAGYGILAAEHRPVTLGASLRDAIIGELAGADCIVADVTDRNPNVFFELGLAQAMGKGLLIISHERSINNIPFDVREFQILVYDDTLRSLDQLSKKIQASLQEYQSSPKRSPILRNSPLYSAPFFTDWGRLEKTEIENLCRELLAQMGFQRLEWGKITPEIDLVAELPRKDPDGFEYRELWLISMGHNVPLEMFLDVTMDDPEYFFHRILKYSENFEKSFNSSETPVTFLIIQTQENRSSDHIEQVIQRMERRRSRRNSLAYNLRFRLWNQTYLTSLVHQFPQIGYKYFSDESRIRSRSRKSYEELYRENSDHVLRQAKLISELEEEKNKRVRAERDAIWKDISFSAAHKIGNPIFAIETDLDPLSKRIIEHREDEAIEVVSNIRSSVEKAKTVVEQFKSLARSQEIKPTATLLLPHLEDATKLLKKVDVECKIDCPPELSVWVDPERLSECLDELVSNSVHWLDKSDKRIEFLTVCPPPEPLPSFLDTNTKYVLLHVKDTGCGIPVANKEKIFNAFFTTYDHGSGLGLALVRRIIDGHGGGIVESGVPGQGADFEIYLPLPPEQNFEKKVVAKKK